MNQSDETSPPLPTPLPPTAARLPADGAAPHALTTRGVAGSLQQTQKPAQPPRMRTRSIAEQALAPLLPAGLRSWWAIWVRRAGWLILLTLLILLPVGQWGSSPDNLFAAATAARAAWRYDRALEDYARIAQLDPSDPRPHCLQGQVLALQQRYAQAQAAYAECERLGDTGPNVWLAQGDAAHSGGQIGEAERAWLRAIAVGSRTAHRRLALLYEQEGRVADAEAQWRALGPADAQAQEHLGLLALQAGNYDAARQALVAARSLPGLYGQEAVDEGFVTLAALPPQDAEGYTALGVAFVDADLLALARQPLEHALALDPGYGPAHAYLGWILLSAGQHTAAATEVADATKLAPGMSFTWFVAGMMAMEDGQWSRAVSDLQTGITHDNRNPVLWAALGRAYLGRRDYIHADLSFSDAAQLGSEPDFTIQLLQFYVTHNLTLGRAVTAAVTALSRFPANARVVVLAGEVYEMSNDIDQAYATYRRANALDPALPDPYFYLGRMSLHGAEYDMAVLDLSTYLALRPAGSLAGQASALLQPLGWLDL